MSPTCTMNSVGLTPHTHPCTHCTGVESFSSQPECVQEAAEEYHDESSMQACGAVDTTDTADHSPKQKELGVVGTSARLLI
jgi:hypothetical protein